MKRNIHTGFITAAFLIINSLSIEGQTVLWAKKGISPGFENGNAIVVDDSGNVYVTGQIEYTSVFDNINLSSYGQHDIMVAKYNSNGGLKWIRHAGGTAGDIGLGIGIDAQHNVYVTGEIEEVAKFSNSISLTSAGNNDGFLAKYSANGNVVWAKRFGDSASSDKSRAIAVSPSGNCYITGNFSNTVSFGSTSLSSSGGNDIFIAKYNSGGSVVWAKKAGGSKQDRGYGIAIDASEDVYVTGSFTSSAKFKSTTITNSGSNSAFLAKYNSGGTFQWVKAAGDCCDTTQANAIAIDGSGNIYIAGWFAVKAKFSSTTLTSTGLKDIFVAKYSSSGSLRWAKRAGGSKEDLAFGIAVDNNSNRVYVTGSVESAGSASGNSYTFKGYKDVIIATYDTDGNIKWVKTYGGTRRDIGLAIAVNSQGFIYNTGLFNGTATFSPITLTGYPNQPWADFFVDKIAPPNPPNPPIPDTQTLEVNSNDFESLDISETGQINESGPLFEINIFPNPFSGSFVFKSEKIVSLSIYDVFGNVLLRKENINGEKNIGEDLLPGIYFMNICDGNFRRTYQLIKSE